MTTTKLTAADRERIIDERTTARVVDELDIIDVEAAFDAMIDECYSFASVGGGFEYLRPSRVMRELMQVDYRCGVSDYEDSMDVVEINGDLYNEREVDAIRDEVTDEVDAENDGDDPNEHYSDAAYTHATDDANGAT